MDSVNIRNVLSQHGYEYKGFLGKGGFSSVLLCQSQKYCQNFAIKRSLKHRLTEDEYNHLVALNHPHIIKLYDAFYDDCAQYLVMEYCPNGTIRQKGKLPYDKFVYYAKQILESLAFCHSNKIAHRDIKPENIFLDQYDHIKLADFGMAKQFEPNDKSSDKCGSLMFISPEMLQYQETCPFKADIWALGITFFYMATGLYPFPNNNKEELKQMIFIGDIDFNKFDLHPKIKYLIGKMTIKDPYSRPTALKLLEFPMFSSNNKPLLSSKSNGKLYLTGFHAHSNMALIKKNTFNIENKTNDKNTQSNHNKSHGEIHSYKSLNHYPKMARVNGRFQPVKSS